MVNTSEVSISISQELTILEGLCLPARMLTPSICSHPLPLSFCHMPWASRVPPTGLPARIQRPDEVWTHWTASPQHLLSHYSGLSGWPAFLLPPCWLIARMTAPLLLPSIAVAGLSPVPAPHSLCRGQLPESSGRQDQEHSSTAPALQASPARRQPSLRSLLLSFLLFKDNLSVWPWPLPELLQPSPSSVTLHHSSPLLISTAQETTHFYPFLRSPIWLSPPQVYWSCYHSRHTRTSKWPHPMCTLQAFDPEILFALDRSLHVCFLCVLQVPWPPNHCCSTSLVIRCSPLKSWRSLEFLPWATIFLKIFTFHRSPHVFWCQSLHYAGHSQVSASSSDLFLQLPPGCPPVTPDVT